jgi:hypothetical protein
MCIKGSQNAQVQTKIEGSRADEELIEPKASGGGAIIQETSA